MLGVPVCKGIKGFRSRLEGYKCFEEVINFFDDNEYLESILFIHLQVIFKVIKIQQDIDDIRPLPEKKYQYLMHSYGLDMLETLMKHKCGCSLRGMGEQVFGKLLIEFIKFKKHTDGAIAFMIAITEFDEEEPNQELSQSEIDWLLDSLGDADSDESEYGDEDDDRLSSKQDIDAVLNSMDSKLN
jgi:hypothetical protein